MLTWLGEEWLAMFWTLPRIPFSMYSLDVFSLLPLVSQKPSDLGDMYIDVPFLHAHVGPYFLQQTLFGDQLASVLDEDFQNGESLSVNIQTLFPLEEQFLVWIEPKRAELVNACLGSLGLRL